MIRYSRSSSRHALPALVHLMQAVHRPQNKIQMACRRCRLCLTRLLRTLGAPLVPQSISSHVGLSAPERSQTGLLFYACVCSYSGLTTVLASFLPPLIVLNPLFVTIPHPLGIPFFKMPPVITISEPTPIDSQYSLSHFDTSFMIWFTILLQVSRL